MAGTLKKQLQTYERVAVNIASRFIALRNERKSKWTPHEDLTPPIPLNLQSPKPAKMVWYVKPIELAKVTCRYGDGLRVTVWMQDDKTGKWPVLRLDFQIDIGEHEPKTDIRIEGVELYYLLCGTLHMPVATIVHERSGPYEGSDQHRLGGEDFRVRRMMYTFPNNDALETECLWEWPSPYHDHVVLFEHPVYVKKMTTVSEVP